MGGAGQGKSTLAAALVADGQLKAAAHFCKRSDAARQDVLTVLQSIAYQLSRQFEASFGRTVLTLGTDTAKQFLVEQVQIDSDVAFEELLLKPLRSMKSATSEEGPRAVLLVDALDEAEDQNGGAPNPVLQLLCRLGRVVRTEKLPISLVLTTRPEPGSNLVALQYSWTGEGQDDTSPPRRDRLRALIVLAEAAAIGALGALDARLRIELSADDVEVAVHRRVARPRVDHRERALDIVGVSAQN